MIFRRGYISDALRYLTSFYSSKGNPSSTRSSKYNNKKVLNFISVPITASVIYQTLYKAKSVCSSLEKVELGHVSNFQDGQSREVKLNNGKDIVLVSKVKGKYYCTGSSCPHYSAPFVDGAQTDTCLVCPWHDAKFDIKSGECLNGPCYSDIPVYQVVVEGDKLYAYLPPYPLPQVVEKNKPKFKLHNNETYVICGGGAAAHSTAVTLRDLGFTGRILIYGDEPYLPYYRPHLTKLYHDYSYDKVAQEQALSPQEFYKENKIEYFGGKKVVNIDTSNNTVGLEDGSTVKYDKVVVATGSLSNSLPYTRGMNVSNHITVRTVDDMKKLSKFIKPNNNIVIIGSNFVGCELASSLKPTGVKLTVVSDMETPMENIIGKRGGTVIESLFKKNGVNFIPKSKVTGYKMSGGKITEVLVGNQSIKADCVVEGVGAKVDAKLLPCAKLAPNGTIKVDANFRCQGCPKNVYAAGDIVSYPYHLNGEEISIKHWNVALQHGRVVARNMLGGSSRMESVPFFWSNFFQKGFRFAGVANNIDDIIYEGAVDDYKFVAFYCKDKQVVAMMTMGMDKVGATMSEAFNKNCIPRYSALKIGAANSQSILQCIEKLRT